METKFLILHSKKSHKNNFGLVRQVLIYIYISIQLSGGNGLRFHALFVVDVKENP